MTDSARDPNLPISYELGTLLDTQIAGIASNPIGSQTRSLGQNIDAIFETLQATVNAVRALEVEVAALRR
jgi:enamine deaminase RidA (YjgF/YER057c/UK114 family)